jgi:WD40 repeat protein
MFGPVSSPLRHALLSASEEGRVCVWKEDGSTGYVLSKLLSEGAALPSHGPTTPELWTSLSFSSEHELLIAEPLQLHILLF